MVKSFFCYIAFPVSLLVSLAVIQDEGDVIVIIAATKCFLKLLLVQLAMLCDRGYGYGGICSPLLQLLLYPSLLFY